jgi:sugar phosphate isomerase/epimerase
MKIYSRRKFAKLSLAALPATAWLASLERLDAAEPSHKKPDSKVNGVQIGINVPYSFANPSMSGDEILDKCAQLGLSGVELRTQPVEMFLGAPAEWLFPKKSGKTSGAGTAGKLRDWRRSASIDKAQEFRKKYEDAGVRIEIVKVDGLFTMSDEELDYAFALAKALGGRAISSEISHSKDELKRLGRLADKHQFMVGYHGHATTKPEHWEEAFAVAKYNGANVDLGHFVAGNNISPIPFIQKYHDRITHVHVKDRKFHNGPNMTFGQGDTPIKEVLQLIRENKWNIMAAIEFEYKIPAGSDRMTELARTVQYCRDALA